MAVNANSDGSPATPSVTLKDVAKEAGVSAMTVSRVVNKQSGVSHRTREQVARAIRQLGYRPNQMARGLKANRSRTIGILIPDITNPYFPEVVRGIEDAALQAGYIVFLNNAIESADRELATLDIFGERRVDGVIACSSRLPQSSLAAALGRHPAAVVVNRTLPPAIAGVVRVDHKYGVHQAISHLVDLERKVIGVLAGPEDSYAAAERLRGIEEALSRYDISLPETRVVHSPPYQESGYNATLELLEREKLVDSILCFNDVMAAGALRACSAMGRAVPGDIAVVGHDDIPYAAMFTPPLTTLHVPKYDLGTNAMRMLLDRLHSHNKQAEVVLKPELVVRRSTSG